MSDPFLRPTEHVRVNEQFQAAVVGTGFIGPVHVEALRRAGIAVAGLLGSTPAKSASAARQLGIARAYATFAEVLADPAIQVVHLATPNRLHFEQAAAALRAGKHVLCEKPLGLNSRETAELVKLAAASGLAAGVCHNIRYYPLCQEAAVRFRRGDFGRLFHVTGSYAQDWLSRETDFNWRVQVEQGGALRAVADIGTHWLDLIQFIVGQPVSAVCADLQTVYRERQRPVESGETFSGPAGTARLQTTSIPIQTEDAAQVLLRFQDGAKGSFWVSQVTAGRKNCLRFELAGSRQAMAFDSERPNELWLGQRERANEQLIRDPALLSAAARHFAQYPGGHNEGFPDTFKQLFRAFYGSLAASDWSAPDKFPTFADGHREVLLCEAILRSHREQRWISVGAGP